MKKVVIDDKAIKELLKLELNIRKKIFSKIETLSNFPEIPNIKKLKNFSPKYRLRIANYRVLFDIDDDVITVYSVKHRKSCYK